MIRFFKKHRFFTVILMHLILIVVSYYLSFLLRLDFQIRSYLSLILKTLPLLIVIKMIVFYYFGLFHSSLRYAGMFDVWQILKANIFSSMFFVLTLVFTYSTLGFPRSVFILDLGICTALIGGMRLVYRLFKERFNFHLRVKAKKAIIIGAGEAGIMVLREYRNNPNTNVKIVGFIDDDKSKRNMRIQGVPVFGSREVISEIVERLHVEEIIIAMPSAKGEVIRDIISYCQIPEVKLKIVPGLHKILNGELEIKPREVRPEDLLGREVVRINRKQISDYIKGKRILVTGAAGSIGSELCRQIADFSPAKLILFDYNENDIYFLERELQKDYPALSFKLIIGDVGSVALLKYTFSHTNPQIVFHASAFKHVPLLESNPAAAVKNNVIATRNLIYASEHYGVESFVFISTDKAVNPTSVLGVTKRIGEMILQAKAKRSRTKFMAVRFGNVLGSKGSVVPLFKKQIEVGGPVTITHPEARRYFMSTREAVQLVLQASSTGKGGEIFVLDMGQQIKIVDLAKDLITLSGLRPGQDIAIEFIGLRPGEKLYEETLFNIERDKATKHDNIYIAHPNDFDPKELRRHIKELDRLADIMAEDKIIDKLREIVPFYSSNGNNKK